MSGGCLGEEEEARPDGNPTLDRDLVIARQLGEIESLRRELGMAKEERDRMLCQISKMSFELQMSSIRSLYEADRQSFGRNAMQPKNLERRSGREHASLSESTPIKNRSCSSWEEESCCRDPAICRATTNTRNEGGVSGWTQLSLPCSRGVQDLQTLLSPSPSRKAAAIHSEHAPGKRSQNRYELSEDFLQKQVQFLGRKYGERAWKAAMTIQRAYRQYAMQKKFQALMRPTSKAEKRVSRRYHRPLECSSMAGGAPEGAGEFCPPDFDASRLSPEPPPTPPKQRQTLREPTAGIVDGVHRRLLQAPCPSLDGRFTLGHLPRQEEPSGSSLRPPAALLQGSLPDGQRSLGGSDFFRYHGGCSCSNSSSGVGEMSVCWPRVAGDCDVSLAFSCAGKEAGSSLLSLPSRASDRTFSPSSSCSCSCCSCSSAPSPSFPWHPAGPEAAAGASSPAAAPVVPRRTSSAARKSRRALHGEPASPAVASSPAPFPSVGFPEGSASETAARAAPPKRRGDGDEEGPAPLPSAPSPGSAVTLATAYGAATASPGKQQQQQQMSENLTKRKYRVGLNLFNKKPDKGIAYLIKMRFLENSPQAVAKFLMTRKGLSKQMIGEYLGNIQNQFNMTVLESFSREVDLRSTHLDVGLRKFQTYFRMPGEAQKIERLMEMFALQYIQCNPHMLTKFRNAKDTILVLAFAIVMLNTDLHSPCVKSDKKMKADEFLRNLRCVDDGSDVEKEMLLGIYERIKANEFRPSPDHVNQVLKVEQSIVGKKQSFAVPHRRLVCYCRLYEVPDSCRKERHGLHQREVFLFNDLLVVTKLQGKKKSSVTYTFRKSFPLVKLKVILLKNAYYMHLIKIIDRISGRTLIVFNARNEHDRQNFSEDLRESICEMDEMDNFRIEQELEKQAACRSSRLSDNRDSGIADVELCSESLDAASLKRSTLSNSLLVIPDGDGKLRRRNSVGSLDSGMSVSFHSTSNSTASRASSPQNLSASQTFPLPRPGATALQALRHGSVPLPSPKDGT